MRGFNWLLPLALPTLLTLTLGASADDTKRKKARPGDGDKQARNELPSLSGKVVETKEVGVRGQEAKHLVAVVEIKGGRRVAVDLGPKDGLGDVRLSKGEKITAGGRLARTGARTLLLASRITAGDETREVKRGTGPRSSVGLLEAKGTVRKIEDVKLRGGEATHALAVLRTDKDQLLTVDLGPKSGLKGLRLRAGDEVSVRGKTALVATRTVFLASRLTAGDRTVSIKRPAPNRGPAAKEEAFTGTVKSMKRVDAPGQQARHVAALLETEEGREVLVDLGPTTSYKEKDARVHTGDKITVRGQVFQLGQFRALKASRVTRDGQTVTVRRSARPEGEARRVSGKVVRTREVSAGQGDAQHLAVLLDTGEGGRVIVDLGPATRLKDVPLSRGERISVRGRSVQAAGQELLYADQLTAGGEALPIKRGGGAKEGSPGTKR